MKKDLDFEIKRLLTLVEAKQGDIKPILYGRMNYENTLKEESSNIDRRQQFSQMLQNNEIPGCKNLSYFGNSQPLSDEVLNNIKGQPTSTIKSLIKGKKFAEADCISKSQGGKNLPLAIFDVISPENPNALVVVKLKRKDGKIIGGVIGHKDMSEGIFGTANKLYVADESNLSFDQQKMLQNLLDNSTKLTGSKIFALVPDGEEPNNYEPIDLITGKGINNGQQYIDPSTLNPNGLGPAFKQNKYNKFIAYVKKATKNTEMDLRQQVEIQLNKYYTTDESKFAVNPDGSPKYTGENPVENPQGVNDPRIRPANLSTDPTGKYGWITLQQFCSVNENQCYEGSPLKEYITLYADKPLKLYPLKTKAMRTRDAGETALSKRQSKRADKKGTKNMGITRENCRAAYDILLRVLKIDFENDQQFEDDVNSAVNSIKSYDGVDTWMGGGSSKIQNVKDILNKCKYASNIGNNFKKKLATDSKLNSDHPASLASDKKVTTKTTTVNPMKEPSELSESISRSLRKVLKEHTKPNSDDIIKKSIRKNLKRLK